MNVKTLAQVVPAKVRTWIYIALGVLVPLEVIWDVIPGEYEGKILASLAALGFGMAALNTGDPLPPPPPPAPDTEPES